MKYLIITFKFLYKLIVGTGGQVGVSGANLLLSITLMLNILPHEFGVYAFINIIIFLSYGISNALLSSPMMVALHREHTEDSQKEKIINSYFMMSFVLGIVVAFIIFIISLIMSENSQTSILFAITSFFLFITRLARTYLYDQKKPIRVLISDGTYALIAAIGTIIVYIGHQISLTSIMTIITTATIFSALAMGPYIWRLQAKSFLSCNLSPFYIGLKNHGRYAIVGVLSTEATSRAHAYIVTIILGPSAFAPIATAALFFRPVSLVVFSLGQFERAKLARLLMHGQKLLAWQKLQFFYISMALVWVFNVILAAVVILFIADNTLGDKYDIPTLTVGIIFYALITASISVRGPVSTLMQANASFKTLSKATVISSIVAISTVSVIVCFADAIWSLSGVVLAELIASILIFRAAKKEIRY